MLCVVGDERESAGASGGEEVAAAGTPGANARGCSVRGRGDDVEPGQRPASVVGERVRANRRGDAFGDDFRRATAVGGGGRFGGAGAGGHGAFTRTAPNPLVTARSA